MTSVLERPTAAPARRDRDGLTGTGSLLRLALRRDRIRATVWTAGVLAFVYSQAASMYQLYPAQADLDRLAATYQNNPNPGIAAITGPPVALNTYGGATAWQVVVFETTILALMSYLLVVRHTRAEEEAGRSDLLDAGPVGRHARLAAALLYVGLLNGVIALLSVAALIATGLPAAGSIAMAVACGSTGLVFAAVGALTAQLTEHARPASGLAGALLGAAFLLRAAGDTASVDGHGSGSGSALIWLSPIGWTEQVRAYAGNRWWVLLVPAGVTLVLLAAVFALRSRRDAGAGLLAARLGPASAPPSLRGPVGLAWRLHRGSILGWAVGTAIAGAVFGGLAPDIVTAAEGDSATADALTTYSGASGDLADVYLAIVFLLVGMVVAGFAVQAVLRALTEETEFRAEPLLAAAVSRLRWASGHVLAAVLGPVAILAAAGFASGVAYAVRTGDHGAIGRLLGTALGQLPAVWVLAGVAVALFGLRPRWTAAAWGGLLLSVVITQFGPLLRLDSWVRDLSPFGHLPLLPAADATPAPYLWLVAVAAASTAAGLAGLRRRDIR
ncbi:ABC transporter permease [Cryptosporangium sp. NPDC051539]|uniref:ABC transporter permease n=1 Tax=Cryptosporangium sp. NPDC051539 TaxID=3363962 RepID=UPI0037A74CC5